MPGIINRFQSELVRAALAWAARGCVETVTNGGSCIDEVHRAFGTQKREPYCTMLVWVVVEQAARAAGIKNPLPKTALSCDLLQRSIAAGLRVDKTPGIGSIAYRSTRIANSSGHTLVVVDVNDREVRTVEGNNANRIDDWLYPIDKVRSHPRYKNCQRGPGWDFIHIEDAGGSPTIALDHTSELVSAGPSVGAIALILGTMAGAYVATNALRR